MTAMSTFITRACTIERATDAQREQTSSPHYIPGRGLDVPRNIAPNCRHARVSGVHRQTPGLSPDIPPGSESLAWVASSMTLIYGRRNAVLLDTFLTSRAMETSVWRRVSWHSGDLLLLPHGSLGDGRTQTGFARIGESARGSGARPDARAPR
jgi:hypothetical protein